MNANLNIGPMDIDRVVIYGCVGRSGGGDVVAGVEQRGTSLVVYAQKRSRRRRVRVGGGIV